MKQLSALKKSRMYQTVLVNRHFSDLNPLLLGYEECHPEHSFGPYIRNYTLIHYVISGKGTVYKRDTVYRVNAGEAFLIFPDEMVTYTADADEPWCYEWVAFDGALSKKFLQLPTVIKFPSGLIYEIRNVADTPMREYMIVSLLFRMYAELFEGKKAHNHYVRRVKDHIHALYMQPLRVEEIAEKMNLDRRYLSRVFKEKTGQTVQEYLIHVRMEASKARLNEGFSVAAAAKLCGYDDSTNFSKMFKRCYGVSPANWRKYQKS